MDPSLDEILPPAANAAWRCAGNGAGRRVRTRLACAIALTVAIGVVVNEAPVGQSPVSYVDVEDPDCRDEPGFGSESRPFCTLRYVSTIAVPGNTFLIKAGRYSDGPLKFLRSGTATAPITYRALGDVVIGLYEDVQDEHFQPTQYPHVYSVAWDLTTSRVHQTYFDPILVDDPNQTIFTMKQGDGPVFLNAVTNDASVAAHEGTWWHDAVTRRLYVHPYGNRAPSTVGTDLLVSLSGAALVVEEATQYNIFDGFRVTYSGSGATFLILGSNNRFRNLTFQGTPWQIRGSNNHAENITVTHVITRGTTWKWHENGDGTAMAVRGSGHRLQNIHVFHNWNSSVAAEDTPGLVIDGLRAHGAPNHCGSTATNTTVRNAVLYNCQDYFYLYQTDNVLIEHTVNPSGIALQGISGPAGKVTVRNSVLSGSFGYTTASKPVYCAWESVSLLENNVISTAATIERCADGVAYPIAEYVSKCQTGVFTGCMTIRNNRMVSDFRTVIRGGMWNPTMGDSWDVSLVANSPAIDAGTLSGAARDILGVLRPQGTAPDSGVYEYCGPGCPRFPAPPARLRLIVR
jgi:hypothetical protein